MTTVLERSITPRRRDVLTKRERDCLILSGKGLSEKEVAQELDISPNTVRVHIENIKRKLGASNKSHAIVLSLLRAETELSEFDTSLVAAPLDTVG